MTSPRNTRQRRDRRHQKRIAALVGALGLGVMSYVALTAGNGLPLVKYRYLSARFANAAEIDPYSDVRIGGRLVGQVLGSSLSGGSATVTMQLQPSVAPLRSDTTARIRLRGLIGAKYVELNAGTRGRLLPSGATLPEAQTSTAVDVFDVLSALDQRRRTDLRRVLNGLGEGYLGRGGQLNIALHQSPALAAELRAVADSIDAIPGAAQRFVPGLQSLAAAFDPVRSDLAAGWLPQAQALRPWTLERPSVQAALGVAPSTLQTVTRGLAAANPMLVQVAGLSRAVTEMTRYAPSGFTAATQLLGQAATPLDRARRLALSTVLAAPRALHLLIGSWPLAAPSARALENQVPVLLQIGHYRCDVAGFTQDWSELFALGSPPGTPIGLYGEARSSLATNNTASAANGHGLHGRYYEAPCTATQDRAP